MDASACCPFQTADFQASERAKVILLRHRQAGSQCYSGNTSEQLQTHYFNSVKFFIQEYFQIQLLALKTSKVANKI